ncbi:non-homologous end-joining DNA ligase [uncultured Cellulomonas sp.]|uniref:non-homologous end-joining DNA ligase n=1 Tax=uncultured Cellulomonas sp. TaxID=189682 RepID=UPI00345C036A
MLATRAATPADLPRGAEWAYEVKWDGVRLLADTTSGRLRLLSRNGRDATVAYPELAGLGALGGAVLDGEVVAMSGGIPSFEALAERMHVRDAARASALAARAPVTLLVFDVLRLYGVDLTRRPFDERRATLERLDLPEHVQLSPVYPDGDALWEVTRQHGLEGVLAKRRSSVYQPGRRSPDWVKAAHRTTRTALVGGWRVETTARDRIGSLLLGAPDADGRLRFLGRAGSGLGGPLAGRVAALLAPLERPTSPFDEPVPAVDARGAHWCTPTVLVDITYLTRMRSGRMRQPVVRGVRDDTAADPWESL